MACRVRQKKGRIVFRRLVSACLLFVFIVNQLFTFPSYAGNAGEIPRSNRPGLPASPQEIVVPRKLGKILETYRGSENKTVVLIQDAHAVPEAQRNIRKLIDYFQKRYGLKIVSAEGAASRLDLQIFRSFPDKNLLGQVIGRYLDEGEMTGLTAAAAGAVVRTWRDRVRALEQDPGCAYVQLFKNHGRNAGASLSHPHSQIVGLPVVPARIGEEIEAAARFRAVHGECLSCRVLEEEIDDGRRVILDEAGFVATAPFASRFPYEVRLEPRGHPGRFAELEDVRAGSLARRLRTVLGRLRRSLGDPPFNLLLRQAPAPGRGGRPDEEVAASFHWRIEILPILARAAGFEWGTGIHINPVAPEAAAARLGRESA